MVYNQKLYQQWDYLISEKIWCPSTGELKMFPVNDCILLDTVFFNCFLEAPFLVWKTSPHKQKLKFHVTGNSLYLQKQNLIENKFWRIITLSMLSINLSSWTSKPLFSIRRNSLQSETNYVSLRVHHLLQKRRKQTKTALTNQVVRKPTKNGTLLKN